MNSLSSDKGSQCELPLTCLLFFGILALRRHSVDTHCAGILPLKHQDHGRSLLALCTSLLASSADGYAYGGALDVGEGLSSATVNGLVMVNNIADYGSSVHFQGSYDIDITICGFESNQGVARQLRYATIDIQQLVQMSALFEEKIVQSIFQL